MALLDHKHALLTTQNAELDALQDSLADQPQALKILRQSAKRVAQGQSPVSDVYWEVDVFDRWGNASHYTLGNGVTTTCAYDDANNTLVGITAKAGSQWIQRAAFAYDKVGNLTVRHDKHVNIHETFHYDDLYRLESSQIGGKFSDTKTWRYDDNGNLTQHASRLCTGITSDCLAYNHSHHPHAVSEAGQVSYQYDANGSMYSSSDGRRISWTAFNKPAALSQAANDTYATTRHLRFAYGAEHQRIRQVSVLDTQAANQASVTETTWYLGKGYLQIDKPGGVTEHHHQLPVPGASVLVVRHDNASNNTQAESTSYLHQDHLGSTSVITGRDTAGNVTVLERQYYDAFGLPLQGSDDARTAKIQRSDISQQGYTGHEMLTAFGLIQMNARLYDPVLGRFVSADTFVQAPQNLQSYNRYSYVLNNPLTYTDPTGHFFKKILNAHRDAWRWVRNNPEVVAMVIVSVASAGIGAAVATNLGLTGLAATAVTGAVSHAINSSVATLMAGGDGGDVVTAAVRGAATGGIRGALLGEISGMEAGLGSLMAQGAANGAVNMLQGGDSEQAFKSGFISGIISAGAHRSGFTGLGGDSLGGQAAVAAVVGGTTSQASGGDFANGAVSAAFATLLVSPNRASPTSKPNITGSDKVAFVGGAGDNTFGARVVKAKWKAYTDMHGDDSAEYFEWTQAEALRTYIADNNGRVTVVAHSYGADEAAH